MSEEQIRILKMIEEQKITAEDGAKLLGALSSANAARERASSQTEAGRGRWNAGGWAWGAPPPVPPMPPIPPVPPIPPYDPFEFAFRRSGRDEGRDSGRLGREEGRQAREEGRQAREEARRRRRDTESLESDSRRGGGPRFFRIQVLDPEHTHGAVNVNLPLGLLNFGLQLAGRYLSEDSGISVQTIQAAIEQGVVGTIIDVQQGKDGERRVIISVE